jgi:hypothetical protein
LKANFFEFIRDKDFHEEVAEDFKVALLLKDSIAEFGFF